MKKEPTLIKCPHCGAEYLPEEIFYPNEVFNKNIRPIRESGKIISVETQTLDEKEESFDLEEEFCCIYCNTNFKVKGEAKFTTEEIKDEEFEEEFVVNI